MVIVGFFSEDFLSEFSYLVLGSVMYFLRVDGFERGRI